MAGEDDPPDLTIGPISLWSLRRLNPPTGEYVDPWWVDEIDCRGIVEADGVRVELTGSIPSRNFQAFVDSLQQLYDTLSGLVYFDGSDFGLVISFEAGAGGHVITSAEIWAFGHWEGKLTLRIRLDQSYLPAILAQSRAILERFPVMVELPSVAGAS